MGFRKVMVRLTGKETPYGIPRVSRPNPADGIGVTGQFIGHKFINGEWVHTDDPEAVALSHYVQQMIIEGYLEVLDPNDELYDVSQTAMGRNDAASTKKKTTKKKPRRETGGEDD